MPISGHLANIASYMIRLIDHAVISLLFKPKCSHQTTPYIHSYIFVILYLYDESTNDVFVNIIFFALYN